MSKTITRRQAIAAGVAIAATSTLPMPTEAAADPIAAMFEERNRLFLKGCEISDRLTVLDDAIDAKIPPRPQAPDTYDGYDDPRLVAWRAANDAWREKYCALCEAERQRLGYDALEKESQEVYCQVSDIDGAIIDTPARSAEGLAIKLWVATHYADLFCDDTSMAPHEAAGLYAAFHDHCRLHGLIITGPIGKVGGGYRIVGSNKGEPVS